MKLPLFQIDAFTSEVFKGNPAAVVPMGSWLPDSVLQAIAAENNLAETAYLVPAGSAAWELRWFTPTQEVALCGHATLASAHYLYEAGETAETLRFLTRQSGELKVERMGDAFYRMRLPRIAVTEMHRAEEFAHSLGIAPTETFRGHYAPDEFDDVAVFGSEAIVKNLKPDFKAIAQLTGIGRGVVATARGSDCDFVSRYFAPAAGIDEDPVTGSTHCLLAPFWAERLGKESLFARQLSARGGELHLTLEADAVAVAGYAVTYLSGEIVVPG